MGVDGRKGGGGRRIPPGTAARDASEWIACRGEVRDVLDGQVDCPVTGTPTPLEVCLECHHLAEVWNDRDRESPCSTGSWLR